MRIHIRPLLLALGLATIATGLLLWGTASLQAAPASAPTAYSLQITEIWNGQVNSFYAPDPFRASDHDPILVTLTLQPLTGTLVIEKVAQPVTGTFAFTSTIDGALSFELAAGERVTYTAGVGTYTVSEALPAGYVTGLFCDDPSADSTIDPTTRTATVALAANEMVHCRFNNLLPPVAAQPDSLHFLGKIDLAGAEIAAFDPASKRGFVTSSNGLQIIDLSVPATPTLISTISPTTTLGFNSAAVTSVAVSHGIVAAALPDADTQQPGNVLFFDADGNLLGSVTVGALPDMLTFTPDGAKVLVANEGEPGATDPEGSVSIIDLSSGVASATVQTADFTAFNGQEAALRSQGVRIFPGKSVAEDVEPEYIAVSLDGSQAFVVLQEANSVAVLDIASATITAIKSLGLKDHSLPGNSLDASNRDGGINLNNWPVFGMYMPDGIRSFGANGQTYYITANEGDARSEDTRIKDLTLDPTAFPDAATLQQDAYLGRLNASSIDGDTDSDGDVDKLYVYGARSFTIWDAAGAQVYDSGNDIGLITAKQTPGLFNANNGVPEQFDQRSDDKGAEPEAAEIGYVDGRVIAFIGLERAGGGVLVYDVTDPAAPVFQQYIRHEGDIAPEGLRFVPAAQSPNGRPLLLVANEVSNTLTIYEMDSDFNVYVPLIAK